MMIVAKVAVALSPSCRASRYGRITSPARAGSTALAAKPIVVVRNAGAKPRVADRREQVLPPQRAQHHRQHRDGRRQRNQPRIGMPDLRPDDVEMGAAKEKREQANRQHDDDDGAKRFPHEFRRKQRVYYKGGCGECQERISSGVASYRTSSIRSALFALRLEVSHCHRRRLILETSLDGLTRHSQGKVRDIYSFPDDPSVLLIVATDRISAFDYVLGSGIPDKGKVLTQLSAFWFGETSDIVANHMRSTRVGGLSRPPPGSTPTSCSGRSMLVRKTEPFPIECVARGYLSGSGWKEYQQTGSVCGVKLPAGLRESDRLPEPIFTPATKAATGHDVNISEEEAGRDRRTRDDRKAAQHDAAALLARRGPRRTPRHHRRRHEVRVRPRRSTARTRATSSSSTKC